ncbi:glycoprotein-N-acetylgalactosamine 3-beta-galactosyltransferase 1-like [Ornithodoros turicata]|uniref:glycoprotein-N-acetylgalactosamine 3-beta-galactosyltransferase 1-like n=1 Tax=Ornithodoros turicata TaxID=34597 RepID=UPI0031387944
MMTKADGQGIVDLKALSNLLGWLCVPARGFSRQFLITLCVGMTFGFGFACLRWRALDEPRFWMRNTLAWMSGPPRLRQLFHGAGPGVDSDNESGPDKPLALYGTDEKFHHEDDDRVAQILKKRVRLLCWVMTTPANHATRAKHVKATWGRRCNVLLFMSSQWDPGLPAIALPVNESRSYLWGKTKAAFTEVYNNYLNESDWFLKADDDTYVIVENLRYFLLDKNSSEPIYYGCRFKPYVKQGYMSGGAGYVLSREAVKRFVEQALQDPSKCRQEQDSAEDVEMGQCLEEVGVQAGDSRDILGKGRFFPLMPECHLIPGELDRDSWLWRWVYYPIEEGMNCCSDTTISFHYIGPDLMYVMEYLIYHLRSYGIFSKVHCREDNSASNNTTFAAV